MTGADHLELGCPTRKKGKKAHAYWGCWVGRGSLSRGPGSWVSGKSFPGGREGREGQRRGQLSAFLLPPLLSSRPTVSCCGPCCWLVLGWGLPVKLLAAPLAEIKFP